MIRTSVKKTAIALGAVMAVTSPAFAHTAASIDAQAETQATEAPAAQTAPQVTPPQAGETIQPQPEPEPEVGVPGPGQVGAFKGGSIVALNGTYRAVGQVFRPISIDPIGKFAFMIEVYDGSVMLTGELMEWDAQQGSGTSLWTSNELVERNNERLEPLAFETGGIVLDPAKHYLMVVRLQDSNSEKGAGIGAAYPGEYEGGYMVRQEAEGYKILETVDATFLVLPKTSSASSVEPAAEPASEPAEQPIAD